MTEEKPKEKVEEKIDEHREKAIPGKKKRMVENLQELIDNKRTILIASIKNLPAKQFQDISKMLRGQAEVRVPKKSLIFRAIENSSNKEVKELEKYFDDSVAILFSDTEAFDLAADLIKNKTSAKAKPGQEAPEDIVIKAGPTDLVPGPAISELGAVGIPIEIKEGKINIKEDKTIVKQGEAIKQEAADIMSKLDIKPFSIGFVPLCAFDTKEKKLYGEINIDPEGTLEKLKEAHGRALPFAVERGYATEDTIKLLLQKAERHAKGIESISGKKEEVVEEKKEDAEEEKAEEEKGGGKVEESPAEEKPAEEEKKEDQTPEDKSGEEK